MCGGGLRGGPPTCDLQLLPADLTLEVKAPPPFGVVGSAKAGHVHDTLVMDVHVAGWRGGDGEMKEREGD